MQGRPQACRNLGDDCVRERVRLGKDPELALQCEEPEALLLSLEERPVSLPRPFVHLDPSYPDLVNKAVATGFYGLADEEELPERPEGGPLFQGGFAVPKDNPLPLREEDG